MAWTTPRTWVAAELVTASLGNTHWRDNLNALRDYLLGNQDLGATWHILTRSLQIDTGTIIGLRINRGGVVVNSNGIVAAINVICWRASQAATVTNVRAYRVGGTGATINARKNGSSNHLSSALSLTSADTWMDGGTVQNTAYAVGDKMEIMVVSAAGSPTQLGIQVDLDLA